MAKKERKDSQGGKDRGGQQNSAPPEPERESLMALKGIFGKIAPLVKPLGLSPEESTHLVEQMYGSVLEMDVQLAGESDEKRRTKILNHIQNANIQREDGDLVITYPE